MPHEDLNSKLNNIHDLLPPPYEWCEIPAGQVTIVGGVHMPDYKEMFEVQPFWMGKYHVTFPQFQVFIDTQDGFYNETWWQGLAATAKTKKKPGKQEPISDNHPRERVSWFDMIAFCRWLSFKLGVAVRLPTEWEWQRAAQGREGRTFPWGDKLDTTKCNILESGIGQPIPVDRYPQGASPFGVLDMAGNVWDWCLNDFFEPTNISVEGDVRRVVRGGAWNHPVKFAHTDSRWFRLPKTRGLRQGFRVVAET